MLVGAPRRRRSVSGAAPYKGCSAWTPIGEGAGIGMGAGSVEGTVEADSAAAAAAAAGEEEKVGVSVEC